METGMRLSVGELARAAGMTAKALRHYDAVGLFPPDGVDDATGYRWYAAERLPQARLVARLRGVGLPLDAVAECLAAGGDPMVVQRVLAAHRTRLEARLARLQGDLHRLGHLVGDSEDEAPGEDAAAPDPARTALTAPPVPPQPPRPAADERQLAVDLFNGVWRLLETEDRSPAQDDRMLHMAHASRFHWAAAGGPQNLARGEWQCSRVYATLGRAEPALHHARRTLELCEEHGLADWDLAFAHEALARAHAVAGDPEAARHHVALALATPVADPEARDLLLVDLRSVPGDPMDERRLVSQG